MCVRKSKTVVFRTTKMLFIKKIKSNYRVFLIPYYQRCSTKLLDCVEMNAKLGDVVQINQEQGIICKVLSVHHSQQIKQRCLVEYIVQHWPIMVIIVLQMSKSTYLKNHIIQSSGGMSSVAACISMLARKVTSSSQHQSSLNNKIRMKYASNYPVNVIFMADCQGKWNHKMVFVSTFKNYVGRLFQFQKSINSKQDTTTWS